MEIGLCMQTEEVGELQSSISVKIDAEMPRTCRDVMAYDLCVPHAAT